MFNCKLYTEKEIHEIRKNNLILSGNDYFIGQDEKRRNNTILHVELPYTMGNYSLFYKGTQETLVNACAAMVQLLNAENMPKKEQNKLYKIIIESLHIVHHISTEKNHSKLNGINSLSTSCLDNRFCIERMKKADCICSHCYASTQQKTQLALQDRNIINGIILRNVIIPVQAWKRFFNPANISKFFRIESFGDVQNVTQAINYINFMQAFPRVHFAVWTKNTGIWHFAMQDAGKPENMVYIVSSDSVNKPNTYSEKTFAGIDHVFTVYDKKYIAENNIAINCGGRSCMECIKRRQGCYFRNTEHSINEILK